MSEAYWTRWTIKQLSRNNWFIGSFLQNALSEANFRAPGGAAPGGSGRRGPELRDAEYLIDRERHHAEHEVAFDLDAPRTRTDRAPNSSFSRALTRSAMVRK